MRVAVSPQVRSRSTVKTFPAPVRGWIENENLAINKGLGATVLENCFPLVDTVRVRKGMLKVATVGADVKTLIPYRQPGAGKFFATTASALYDVSGFDADTVPTAAWTQLTSGKFSFCQFAIADDPFLVMVNGADPALVYDGTDWFPVTDEVISELSYDALTEDFVVGRTLTGGTSAATATILGVIPATATTGKLILGAITTGPFQDNETITGASTGGSATAAGGSATLSQATVTGVDTSDLVLVWHYKSALWFLEKDSLKAWYLPVDSIGGEARDFDLGGVFGRGGKLLIGATWSADSGDGMDDRLVFVTDQGEVAVFQGSNPDFDDWAQIGRFDIGAPVSDQTMRAGGDLLICTSDGIVPVSAILTKDPAALAMAAVSYPIQPAWLRVIKSLGTDFVQVLKWQRESMGIFAYPYRTDETHVVNLTTGAWSKWKGLDIQCMGLYGDRAFYGDSSGAIFLVEGTGSDDGAPYTARMSLQPSHLDMPGNMKTVLQARATHKYLAAFNYKISVVTDYQGDFPPAPPAAPDAGGPALWGTALWGTGIWGGGEDSEARRTVLDRWRSIGRTGFMHAIQWQATYGATRKPDTELVVIELLYEPGEPVV